MDAVTVLPKLAPRLCDAAVGLGCLGLATGGMLQAAWLPPVAAVGAGGAYAAFRWTSGRRRDTAQRARRESRPERSSLSARSEAQSASRRAAGRAPAGDDPDSLVETMLAQGRYALLLRPQIAENLTAAQRERAVAALHETMALTPEGDVLLRSRFDSSLAGEETGAERIVRVKALFLDRYAVTNAQFKKFVEAGGYEQMSLWSPEVWPGVLNFVDQTGCPGPRFWRDQQFPAGQADHPVVGVSWFEAGAYARWVGKRLPSDPEWVKAAAWPVPSAGGPPIQRKFPWGDTMERCRANLWGTGAGGTAPAHEYEEGASVGGVCQLVGNVWEWTSGVFGDSAARRLELPSPMKSIRGGAFDTYFDTHATCQFQSGEGPLERRHNVGFRCAVGICDLALDMADEAAADSPAASEDAENEVLA